jgi:RHS repeat-associated protein
VAGQVSAFSYGNGVTASFGFNAARLQLESLSYAQGSTALLSLAYGYAQNGGNNGQITSITDNTGTPEGGRSVTYTYDALHRLKTAETTGSTSFPKWGLEWTYDRYGNRTAQSIVSGCVSPMTCPTNSVSVDSSTNRLTGSPYTYDENGNMLNDGLNTLTYDAESRVVRVNSSNPMYVYDGAGLRVKKCDPHCTSPTTTTVYIFSGSKVIAEYVNGAAVNSPTREYVYSGSQLIATHEGTSLKFHHQDHLSRRVTSDGTSGSQTYGQKIAESGHFPYGESWYESGGTNKFKFTSYERDSESGNDYAMARFYINRFGRFCSPDPLAGSTGNPQSLNRFAYVTSDPVNFTDPLGLCIYYSRCDDETEKCTTEEAFCIGGIGDWMEILPPSDPEPKKTKCTFNIYLYYTVGNSSLTEGMLKELRRIYGEAGVDLNIVPRAEDADFLVNVRASDPTSRDSEGRELAGAWRPGGARGGSIEIYLNVLLTASPRASTATLGMAVGAVGGRRKCQGSQRQDGACPRGCLDSRRGNRESASCGWCRRQRERRRGQDGLAIRAWAWAGRHCGASEESGSKRVGCLSVARMCG